MRLVADFVAAPGQDRRRPLRTATTPASATRATRGQGSCGQHLLGLDELEGRSEPRAYEKIGPGRLEGVLHEGVAEARRKPWEHACTGLRQMLATGKK